MCRLKLREIKGKHWSITEPREKERERERLPDYWKGSWKEFELYPVGNDRTVEIIRQGSNKSIFVIFVLICVLG